MSYSPIYGWQKWTRTTIFWLTARCSAIELYANGRSGGTRTPDLRVKSPLLYPLSYTPFSWAVRMESNRHRLIGIARGLQPPGLTTLPNSRMATQPGIEPEYRDRQSLILAIRLLGRLVGVKGIEPMSIDYRSSALPLSYTPVIWSRSGDSNSEPEGYNSPALPIRATSAWGSRGTRTPSYLGHNQALYQLSYCYSNW